MALVSQVAVARWLERPDEKAMLKEWPTLLEKYGLDAIAAWRNEGNQHKPAVVHVLAQNGKARALECVLQAGLSPDVQRGDGCRGERPAGRVELLAKKGASGRMQRPPELVPIPGCCLNAA